MVLFDAVKVFRASARAGVERQLCSPEATWMGLTTPYLTWPSGACRSSEDRIGCTGCTEPGLIRPERGRLLRSGFVWRRCQVWAGVSEADLLLLSLTGGGHLLVVCGRTPACRKNSRRRVEAAKDGWEDESSLVYKASIYSRWVDYLWHSNWRLHYWHLICYINRGNYKENIVKVE